MVLYRLVFAIGGPGAPFLAGGILVALATLLLFPALPVLSAVKEAEKIDAAQEGIAPVSRK